MAWFRIDDGWWRGKKLRKISKRRRINTSARVAAAGVWALCGDWAADQLTDGFVPWEIVEEYDPTHMVAQLLIAAKFWFEDEVDGEDGIRFHDWADWNPTREEVEEKRRQTRERVAKHRAKKAEMSPDMSEGYSEVSAVLSEGDVWAVDNPVTPGDTVFDHSGNGVGNALHAALVTLPPSRPDPSRPSRGQVSRGASGTERGSGPRPLLGVLQGGAQACVCRTHEGWAPDRIPPCPGCADVRRQVDAERATITASEAALRRAFRAAIDSCPDCDDSGRLPDTRVCPCNADVRRALTG